MTYAVRGNTTRPYGARGFFGSEGFLLILAIMIAPAFAAAPSARDAIKGNPRLASLQVEIWPEFDRPAALVILRGALAPDSKLPADVRLRIPTATGGPSAMAYSAQEAGNLLNLPYERQDSNDFVTLHFTVPERYFHVEYYDPLATGNPDRSFSYVWPGDMRVEQLRVVVQEPAAASNFSTQPNLDASAAGQDGLRYHSAELGVQEAGKSLAIKVSYTKMGARTSAEILGQKIPGATPAPAVDSGLTSAPVGGSNDDMMKGVLIFIVAISLLIATCSALLWWRGRAKTLATQPSGSRLCPKCGSLSAPGDKFCSKCGTHLD